MIDRSIAPEIQAFQPFKITRAVSGKLSNGIPIHHIRSGSQPILKMEVIFNSGNYFEKVQGVSSFTSKMLQEGTKNFTSKQIAQTIEGFGAHLEMETGKDKCAITLVTLEKHFSKLLPLVNEIIHESIFQAKNFDLVKSIALNQIKVNLEKTSFVASGLFRKSIFGETHPYGYFLDDTLAQKIDLQSVNNHYQKNIKESTFEIVLSGMVSEFIIDEINQILGQNSFKLIPTPVIQKEIKTLTASSVKKEKKDAVQTSIRIGKKLFTRNHPDYLKFTVLNETLGGYFGSRLMKNIREEKGLTYGISSQIAPMLQEGYFVIGTDVKKELASKALEEIYNELEKLQNEPVGDEELQTVKNYMIGSYSNSITTPFSLANKFKTLHFNGLSYDYYDNYMTAIQKVNAKDLMQMAKKYFDRTSFTEVLVG